ncbi:MAG TPA: type II toxin-antitoxin system prevent-host-death family antitoxin [Gemmatimonadales bacterium]
MKKTRERTVKVAELKARLSEHLRAVRRGHAVTVCDRETPIARLVPYETIAEPLTVRHPIRPLHAVPFPPPLGRHVDSLAALLEEREPTR